MHATNDKDVLRTLPVKADTSLQNSKHETSRVKLFLIIDIRFHAKMRTLIFPHWPRFLFYNIRYFISANLSVTKNKVIKLKEYIKVFQKKLDFPYKTYLAVFHETNEIDLSNRRILFESNKLHWNIILTSFEVDGKMKQLFMSIMLSWPI